MACTSLLLLLLLVTSQVLLRNLFDSGIPHADILSHAVACFRAAIETYKSNT